MWLWNIQFEFNVISLRYFVKPNWWRRKESSLLCTTYDIKYRLYDNAELLKGSAYILLVLFQRLKRKPSNLGLDLMNAYWKGSIISMHTENASFFLTNGCQNGLNLEALLILALPLYIFKNQLISFPVKFMQATKTSQFPLFNYWFRNSELT